MTTQEIDKVLEIAASWTGYLEKSMRQTAWYEQKRTGSGAGNFTRFGRIADIVVSGKDRRNKDGYAWCCMFLLSCLYESKAGHVDTTKPDGTITPDKAAIHWIKRQISNGQPLTYFAGCQAWLNAFRHSGGVSNVPTRGSFILFMKGSKPYHIGIVESVSGDGYVTTIEGNTNYTGTEIDANGGSVARKRRRVKNCLFLKTNY